MNLNRPWLDKALRQRGISAYALKRSHHFSPETFDAWEKGALARPATLKRLASILGVELRELIRNLGVKVMVTKALVQELGIETLLGARKRA